MISAILTMGYVTADLELKTSQNNKSYVNFSLAVAKGFGDHQHTNFYQCVLYDKDAERIVNAGVKKGSFISIAGNLDVTGYTRNDGSKGTNLNVTLYDWSYTPFNRTNTTDDSNAVSGDIANDDYEQTNCGPEGLPFN